MECFICSANLENTKHRHFKERPCCLTCDFEFVTAHYYVQSTFMIPKAWKKEDYWIKWDTLFYKGEEMDFKIQNTDDDSEAYKRPGEEEITQDGDNFECDEYFDCEEDETEDDREKNRLDARLIRLCQDYNIPHELPLTDASRIILEEQVREELRRRSNLRNT